MRPLRALGDAGLDGPDVESEIPDSGDQVERDRAGDAALAPGGADRQVLLGDERLWLGISARIDLVQMPG